MNFEVEFLKKRKKNSAIGSERENNHISTKAWLPQRRFFFVHENVYACSAQIVGRNLEET